MMTYDEQRKYEYRMQSDLRVGDEVKFRARGEVTIVGVITKINRKTIKVEQTNAAYRYTKGGFGRRGGRKQGGRGCVWSTPVDDRGLTRLQWTEEHCRRMEGTARAAQLNRCARNDDLNRIQYYIERAMAGGAQEEELLKHVQDVIDAAKSPAVA